MPNPPKLWTGRKERIADAKPWNTRTYVHPDNWRGRKKSLFSQVLDAATKMQEYWPLTLRQLFYRLVAAQIVPNDLSHYKTISAMLTEARLANWFPWDAIEDRGRQTLRSAGYLDHVQFLDSELGGFLAGYRRHLLQGQDVVPEVWVEKDALVHLCHQAAFPYCVLGECCRGNTSTSKKNKMRDRVLRHARGGQRTAILYFGDMDPAGWKMPWAIENIVDEMDIREHISVTRCALNEDQVERFSLPGSIDGIKWDAGNPTKGDQNAPEYVERFGWFAAELDAVDPPDLQGLVLEAIEGVLDMDLVEEQRATQEADTERIKGLRKEAGDYIREAAERAWGDTE